MKKLCICFLTALMLCFAFAVPAVAYTETKTVTYTIEDICSYFEERGDNLDWVSIETIDGVDYLYNILTIDKHFNVYLPEEYTSCRVRFLSTTTSASWIGCRLKDGSNKYYNLVFNQYVEFPENVEFFTFSLGANSRYNISEISLKYDIDVPASASDIGIAKDMFSEIFSGLWKNSVGNWVAMFLLASPLAFGLVMLVVKIINSFGGARVGNVRSVALGGIRSKNINPFKLGSVSNPKLGNVKTYNTNGKFKNFNFNKKNRKDISVIEIDGVKYFTNKKIKKKK